MSTKVEKDAVTGTETTGHEWDGIKELNTPLPKWWVYVFYASIIWSIGYYVFYPAWPSLSGYSKGILGWSMREELGQRMAESRKAQQAFFDRIDGATLEGIREDADLVNFAIVGGRAIFADNCAPCHGAGGAGVPGYPSLADDDWLWGGDLASIATTIRVGIRSGHDEAHESDMPSFGADELLEPKEIDDVAEYVLSLSGQGTATEHAAELFADNCAACHGEQGEGLQEFGAPALNDAIWLYGGSKESVVETVTRARRGVMPAWVDRLDDSAIKMLAVYVHGLGGGE